MKVGVKQGIKTRKRMGKEKKYYIERKRVIADTEVQA